MVLKSFTLNAILTGAYFNRNRSKQNSPVNVKRVIKILFKTCPNYEENRPNAAQNTERFSNCSRVLEM